MRDVRRSLRRAGTATAVLALLVLTPLTLAAPWRDRQGPPDPERMIERMSDRLDLTSEQREQIEGLVTRHREETRGQRDQLRDARRALHEQMRAEPFDENAIREAAAAVERIQTDLMVGRAELMHEVRSVLTPEQRERFDQLQQERMERRRHHRERMGPGFGGPGGPGGPGDGR